MSKDSGAGDPAVTYHVSGVDAGRLRRGRVLVTFWVLTVMCAGLGAAVVSPWRSPWLGLVAGALVGAVLGTLASVVMTVWPVVRALWHWTAELVTAAGLAGSATALAGWAGSWWWCAVLLGVGGGGAAVGPVRRWVLAWVWCAVARHRLRVCFAAFIRARNHVDPGLAPLILLARPTPAGERVWVWLRTGLDVAELERRTGKIAVACWASDVQVCASRRFAALVRLDVTRRDPLLMVVASPLAAVPAPHDQLAIAVGDSEPLALDLDGVPEAAAGVGRR
jgi:hypothetical protein